MLLMQVQECPQGQEAISKSCLHRPEWKTVQVYANFGHRFLGQAIDRSKARFCKFVEAKFKIPIIWSEAIFITPQNHDRALSICICLIEPSIKNTLGAFCDSTAIKRRIV